MSLLAKFPSGFRRCTRAAASPGGKARAGARHALPASTGAGNKKNPALHIEEAKGGKVLATCHAGCAFEDVRAALGLDPRPSKGTTRAPRKRERSAQAKIAATRQSTPRSAPDEQYEYLDADGKVLVTVCRVDACDGEPKDIWRKPAGVTKPPSGYPLYRLPSLLTSAKKPLLVVEGEKTAECAQLLFGDRYEVTTSIGGSGSAAHSDWTPATGSRGLHLAGRGHGGCKDMPTRLPSFATRPGRLPSPVSEPTNCRTVGTWRTPFQKGSISRRSSQGQLVYPEGPNRLLKNSDVPT